MTRRWSLRTRFVLGAVACLLPLLGVVLYLLNESVDQGRARVVETERAVGRAVARSVSNTLGENQDVLDDLAREDAIRDLVLEDAQQTLRVAQNYRANLTGLFLLRPSGEEVASVGADPAVFRADLSQAVDRALGVDGAGVTRRLLVDNTEVVAIVVPVLAAPPEAAGPAAPAGAAAGTPPAAGTTEAAEGKPVAVLGAFLPVDRLAPLPEGTDETAIAIVAERQVIAQTADTDVAADDPDLTDQLAEEIAWAVGGATGDASYHDAAGHRRLAVYTPVGFPGADWAVVVSNPAPDTYGANPSLLTRGLVALAAAVAATLVLAFVFGERTARPLRRLTHQAARLARGDFAPSVAADAEPPAGAREIRALGVAFREMAARIADQVRDLEAAREARAGQVAELRELLRRTVRLQEDERRRIAGEIHDAVSPLITGALYQARALRLTNGAADPADRDEGLAAVGDLLERATGELHGVIFALRPPDLDDIGVVAAVERYVAQVQRLGLTVRLEVIGDQQPAMTPEVRLGVYRIVQEALHNVVRHAGADEAVVRLETAAGLLRVTIRDNGAGFDPANAVRPTSLGLLSMRERAAAIGASLHIHSQPGGGTAVVIERPLPPADRVTADWIAADPAWEPFTLADTAGNGPNGPNGQHGQHGQGGETDAPREAAGVGVGRP